MQPDDQDPKRTFRVQSPGPSDRHRLFLASLIASAESYWDRLAHEQKNGPSAAQITDPGGVSRGPLEDAWAGFLGGGDDLLQRRLDWQMLGWAACQAAAERSPAPSHAPAISEIPVWAQYIDDAIRLNQERHCSFTADDSGLGTERLNPLPFEEFWLGFVEAARDRLCWEIRADSRLENRQVEDFMAPRAWQALLRSLLITLANLGGPVLEREFDKVRPASRKLFSVFMADLETPDSSRYYRIFLANLMGDGGLGFLGEWPVLAFLVGRICEFWHQSAVEFLIRLVADYPQLVGLCSDSGDEGRCVQDEVAFIQELIPQCSDRHNNGRTVFLLKLCTGGRWAYKPRSLALECAFNAFLGWCNQQPETPTKQRCLAVLDRGEYGWMEVAEPGVCVTEVQIAAFYRRTGMLMAAVHLLRGSDCHFENLIAAGEWPLLVDCETLLTPELRRELLDPRLRQEFSGDEYTVLQGGFLPCWEYVYQSGRGSSIDVSALGCSSPAESGLRIQGWRHVNQDAMHRAWLQPSPRLLAHRPRLVGQKCYASVDVEAVLSGFRDAYCFFLGNRDFLLSSEGPLSRFRGCLSRYVFRVTRIYDELIAGSVAPSLLADAVARSLYLDKLAVAYLRGPASRELIPLLLAEARALHGLDVPLLQARTDQCHLYQQGRLLGLNLLRTTPFDSVIEALVRMSHADLDRQLALIRGSFQAICARPHDDGRHPSAAGDSITVEQLELEEPISREELIQEACRLADDILSMACPTSSGDLEWIGMALLPNTSQFRVRLLGASLYDGSVGIALFLASLAVQAGRHDYAVAARAAVNKLLNWSLGPDSSSLEMSGVSMLEIGAATGVAGLIYGLVRLGDLLADGDMLAAAESLAGLINGPAIVADQQLDVIAGCAGAILGLLVLHDRTGRSEYLQRAVICGKKLLDDRIQVSGNDLRAWRTTEPDPLTGFSHGAAGICLALLRLHQVTGLKIFSDAALEGLAYEASVFVPEIGNWPDLRKHGDQSPMPWYLVNWCHGAAGIGLARLAAPVWTGNHAIQRDINHAVATTYSWGGQAVDHLCCGNMGRVQLLQQAGLQLQRPELIVHAQKLAGWMVRRAWANGSYRLLPEVREPVQAPGFFQGLAGIGHGLLRLATDGKALSVCQWE